MNSAISKYYTHILQIYLCVYIYMYTNVCIYIYIHKIIHICSYHSYTFTYIHIYIYIHVSLYIYIQHYYIQHYYISLHIMTILILLNYTGSLTWPYLKNAKSKAIWGWFPLQQPSFQWHHDVRSLRFSSWRPTEDHSRNCLAPLYRCKYMGGVPES